MGADALPRLPSSTETLMPPAARWATCQWFSAEPFPNQQTGLDLVVMESRFGPRQRQSLSITILSAIIVIVAETASFPQDPFFLLP